MTALLLFLAWAVLFYAAVFAGLRTPKPRQYPWLTSKKPRSGRTKAQAQAKTLIQGKLDRRRLGTWGQSPALAS